MVEIKSKREIERMMMGVMSEKVKNVKKTTKCEKDYQAKHNFSIGHLLKFECLDVDCPAVEELRWKSWADSLSFSSLAYARRLHQLVLQGQV